MNRRTRQGNPQAITGKAVVAHGGISRWNSFEDIGATVEVDGLSWEQKGQKDAVVRAHYLAIVHHQQATCAAFGAPNQRIDCSPERLRRVDERARKVDQRHIPRASFAGQTNETPWDHFHAAYFIGSALWAYLSQPFRSTHFGVKLDGLDPKREGRAEWNCVRVTLPDWIATHTRQQISYFDEDGLIRRHDYSVDALGCIPICQYIDANEEVRGIIVPKKRRVYLLGNDNRPRLRAPLLLLDFDDIALTAPLARRRLMRRANHGLDGDFP